MSRARSVADLGNQNVLTVSATDGNINVGTGVTIENTGEAQFSGIVTAGTVQIGAATTLHSTGLDLGSGNITSHNITSTGNLSVDGNMDVGGVLTYEDVTSVDSAGIITARSGLHVTGAGSSLGVGTNDPQNILQVGSTTEQDQRISIFSSTTSNDDSYGSLEFRHGVATGNKNAKISALRRGGSSGSDLAFYTRTQGDTTNNDGGEERLRITSAGRVLVGVSTARATKAAASIPYFQIEGTGDSDSRINIGRNTNGDNGPEIHLYKSRGTGLQSNTIVADDDQLGSLIFIGADGSDLYSRGAEIGAFVDGTPADDSIPSRIVLSTTAETESSPTERLRIDSAGRVAIGDPTHSVQALLHIDPKDTTSYSSTTVYPSNNLELQNSVSMASAMMRFRSQSDNGAAGIWNIGAVPISSSTGSNFVFQTRTTSDTYAERMRIDYNGNFLFNVDGHSTINAGPFSSQIPLAEFRLGGTSNNYARLINISNPSGETGSETLGRVGIKLSLGSESNSGNSAKSGLIYAESTSTYNNSVALCFGTNNEERVRIASDGTMTMNKSPRIYADGVQSTPIKLVGHMVGSFGDHQYPVIALARQYTGSVQTVSGFYGHIYLIRGSTGASHTSVDAWVACTSGYNTELRTAVRLGNQAIRWVEFDYDGVSYMGVEQTTAQAAHIWMDGWYYSGPGFQPFAVAQSAITNRSNPQATHNPVLASTSSNSI